MPVRASTTAACSGPKAEDATNATGLVVGKRLLLVHEVKQESKRNGMKVSWVDL